jgi:tetratricopeptide (TPR) repeat protein
MRISGWKETRRGLSIALAFRGSGQPQTGTKERRLSPGWAGLACFLLFCSAVRAAEPEIRRPSRGSDAVAGDSLSLRIENGLAEIGRDSSDWMPHLTLGEAYFLRGDDVAARRHLTQFLMRAPAGPESLRAALLESRVLRRLGLKVRATRSLEWLARRPGASPGVSHDLAILLREDQHPIEAVMAESRAVEHSQGEIAYVREAAAQWKELGLWEQALAMMGIVVDGREAQAEDYFQMGFLNQLLGRWEQARRAFEQALCLEPTNPEAHFNLATLLERSGETEASITHLREVIRLRPLYEPAYFQLATILLKAERSDEAADVLRRFVQVGSDSLALSEAVGILRLLRQEGSTGAGGNHAPAERQ